MQQGKPEDTPPPKRQRPHAVVVMGVAGCGKTVAGTALAKALGATFIEGDRAHPLENVAKMSAGVPLDDDDRVGWLEAIGSALARETADGRGAVAACSALKRKYRDMLRARAPQLVFVHLTLDPPTARRRVASRRSHYMPPSLVDSQFATLEPLQQDEAGIELDSTRPLDQIVDAATFYVRSRASAAA